MKHGEGDANFKTMESLSMVILCSYIKRVNLKGDDARIQAAINQTLKQFSTINKVVILNEQGDCFKDMSGQNLCFED